MEFLLWMFKGIIVKIKFIVIAVLLLFFSVNIMHSKDEDSLVRKRDFKEYCNELHNEVADSLENLTKVIREEFYQEKKDLLSTYLNIIGICFAVIIVLMGSAVTIVIKYINKAKGNIDNEFTKLNTDFINGLSQQKVEFEDELKNARDRLYKLLKKISHFEDKADIFIDADKLIDELNKRRIDITKLGEETEDTKNKLKELSKNIEQREKIGEQLSADDYFFSSLNYYEKGEYDNAINELEKAIAINQDYYDAWYNKGTILAKLERYEEAIEYFDKAIEIKPDYHDAWNNKGNTLAKLERYEEAIACYDKAIAIKPDYHHDACYNKGTVLAELERYEEAIACYDKAIAIKPDKYEAWYNKACTYSLMKNKKEMLISLRKAIELNEENKAKTDEDFKAYWDDPDFIEVTE